jgi:6-pyruvoyltetrahydropterin/6-carboxytetrahydropterin synthase
MFFSTKTFKPMSCTFRNWRAASHCQYMHGYAVEPKAVFRAEQLNDLNWVVDFGGLDSFQRELEHLLDHTTIIAEDDPKLEYFELLNTRKLIQLRMLPFSGSCEMMAKFIFDLAAKWLEANNYDPRVNVHSVEFREHGANSAIYMGD